MSLDPPSARADAALEALRRILRASEHLERELAQEAGLTPAKLRLLRILAGQDDRQATPSLLAARMGISQASVTALLDQLDRMGLTERRRSLGDRRQMHVILTEAGTEALRVLPDGLRVQVAAGFGGMQDWEQAMLVAGLERMAAVLDASRGDAASRDRAPAPPGLMPPGG